MSITRVEKVGQKQLFRELKKAQGKVRSSAGPATFPSPHDHSVSLVQGSVQLPSRNCCLQSCSLVCSSESTQTLKRKAQSELVYTSRAQREKSEALCQASGSLSPTDPNSAAVALCDGLGSLVSGPWISAWCRFSVAHAIPTSQ